ncbi:MAG: hypothetical protein Kow00129_13820 [Thermoleophilia bacterium]
MQTLRNSKRHWVPLLALALILSLAFALAACGEEEADEPAEGETTVSAEEGDEAAVDKPAIRLGLIAWDEAIAVTYLWDHLLKEQGYDTEIVQLDAAPVYAGLAAGDLELYLDAWLPETHGDYWAEYGDSMEDLGIWYDQGLLTLAVPTYVDIDSIADLKGNGDMFGNRIVGIESGAGLMRITRNDVMPGYGLEDEYDLIEGSTPAMLAELERATSNEEPVAVTLWHPHWAYSAYPIKDLEDPENLLGDPEELHVVSRLGFPEDYPQVTEWLSTWEMDDAALSSLTETVVMEYGQGKEAEGVEAWLEDPANRELVDGWISG